MKKIVLVVNNGIIALEIKKHLENRGYLVPLISYTLKKAVKEAYDMDLIIFDIDFISTEHLSEVKVPIIFLSSIDESEISTNNISSLQVTYDFLYKPFNKEELINKTRRMLSPKNKNS